MDLRLWQRWPLGLALWVCLWPVARAVEVASLDTGARDSAANASPMPKERLMPVDITVNGAKAGTWVIAERAGVLYAPQEALEEWRVQAAPTMASVEIQGSRYWALPSVPGYQSHMDLETQSLALTFSPEAFAATRLAQERLPRLVLDPVLPSAFLNYDLAWSRSVLRNAPSIQSLGVLGEWGVSRAQGVFTTSFAGRNLTGDPHLGPSSLVRLESAFVQHWPQTQQTLRLGDGATRFSLMGRPIYFGGIQVGTNYGLSPGFVTQPQPTLRGLSSAPSTVELYVNDVLRQVSNVPTGPFALENLPAVTGSGEARLVVRDLLGRETVVVQPFFTSPQLLAAGLHDWSLSAGRLREGLGTADSRYGAAFGSAQWRHGRSDRLTWELIGEASRDQANASLGLVSALPGHMLGRVGLGGSQQGSGSGWQWLLGLDKQAPRAGVSVQAQGSSPGFRLIGQSAPAPDLQLAGSLSYQTSGRAAVGLGFATIQTHSLAESAATRVSTATVNYSTQVAERATLSVTLSRLLSGPQGTAVGVALVLPLGRRVIGTASVQQRGAERDLLVSASGYQDEAQPVGWRLLAGRQREVERAEGGLYFSGTHGQLSADLSSSRNQDALRLGASGALVWAENQMFASQKLDGSFALVEVAGYPGIGVGLGSTPLTRTNAQGLALVPRLVPYQRNAIRLDASDVPLGAELDSIEQLSVPQGRSAVKVVFPVRSGRAALLRLLLDDGQPAPAGATVSVEGDSEVFYVGHRGQAFLTGLQGTNRLTLNWRDQRCAMALALPATTLEDVIRPAPLVCAGVSR